jgi:nucleotide-binding universal stress UspA family protein
MKFTHILVPISGSPLDDEAIQLACHTARQDQSKVSLHKCKVLLLHIIQVQRALPLNSENNLEIERAENILAHGERVAAECGVTVETDLLQSRSAGAALVDASLERNVDLIVMGLSYRRKPDQFYLGSTTMYVLNHAQCRVWFCRANAPARYKI